MCQYDVRSSYQRDTKTGSSNGYFLLKYMSESPYFFTLTWVKKCSQYFYFYQSIFKHEYLYFFLSEGCVYFCHLW